MCVNVRMPRSVSSRFIATAAGDLQCQASASVEEMYSSMEGLTSVVAQLCARAQGRADKLTKVVQENATLRRRVDELEKELGVAAAKLQSLRAAVQAAMSTSVH